MENGVQVTAQILASFVILAFLLVVGLICVLAGGKILKDSLGRVSLIQRRGNMSHLRSRITWKDRRIAWFEALMSGLVFGVAMIFLISAGMFFKMGLFGV